jgi:hypothetical protein
MLEGIPPFYPNQSDDKHCLQACMMMVLSSRGLPSSWDELDELTGFRVERGTSVSAGTLVLAEQVAGTKFFSKGDYIKRQADGEVETPESTPLRPMQNLAKLLIDKRLFTQFDPNLKRLTSLIEKNYIIAIVNYNKLHGRGLRSAHAVLLFGKEEDSFLLHDPGNPPNPALKINQDHFMNAFQRQGILVPNH